jgi:arylsulfatase A-like enzyme
MTKSNHILTAARLLLGLACLLSLRPARAAEPGAATPNDAPNDAPNFVVIVADDLGWADVGWHDGPYRTPHLDRLCREGVELDQHYVSPMCSPTRAALLSGRYASRFGCTGAQNERVYPFGTVTLASALKEAGYETAIVGKWHLGSDPDWGPHRFGFDHGYGSLAGGCGPYNHRYKLGPFTETWHRNGERITEEGHITDLIAAEAVKWIEGRNEKPFFLYVPFTAVHIPIKEPQQWLDEYAEIGEPDRRQYAACVSHLDDAVGRIVAALESTGKRRETLIVFFSDNGGTQARNNDTKYPPDDYTPGRSHGNNRPLRGNKTQLYEGGIRVSALANWPGRLAPGKHTAPLHAADWMPTFCALAGHAPQADLKWDGRNVWPSLSGAEKPQPRVLYWAGTGFRTAAVRDGDWKLLLNRQTDKAELFDLGRDPFEQTDVTAQEPERTRRLRTLLDEMAARDNDAKVK